MIILQALALQGTVATDELLCLKNAGTMAIKKKSKLWWPFWSYELNSTANLAHSAHILNESTETYLS